MALWLLLRHRTARMRRAVAAALRSPTSSTALQELRQVRHFCLGCHYGGEHRHLRMRQWHKARAGVCCRSSGKWLIVAAAPC